MQISNKKGQRIFGKKTGQKELDGLFHARRPSTKRKRRCHKKAIETKLRQENKKLCQEEKYNAKKNIY
jgi:hypothetical protein